MASWFKARHPRNIPIGYHKPIGQLVDRWNFTELYVQSIIWRIKDPKVARLLTWDLNAVSKVELFKHLVPRWITDAGNQVELEAVAKEVEALRQKKSGSSWHLGIQTWRAKEVAFVSNQTRNAHPAKS